MVDNPLLQNITKGTSNALHLSGTLPKDKEKLLQELDLALEIGQGAFVPKTLRGF